MLVVMDFSLVLLSISMVLSLDLSLVGMGLGLAKVIRHVSLVFGLNW